MYMIVVSLTRVYRAGVWFRFAWFALLLAVVLCWVARCSGSWVLLGLFRLLRVSPLLMHHPGRLLRRSLSSGGPRFQQEDR